LNNHRWAEFRKTKSGIKLHLRLVFLEKGCSYPDKAVLTNAKEHDRGQLEVLVDDKECMYFFDCGYLDYERFERMTDDGYFFVSRLRKKAVIEPFELLEDAFVSSDEMIVIGTTQNRVENAFRLIKVLDSKGNELHLITNRFDFKCRHIKKFYTKREKGVHNQVYIAMIVYCLHVLAQLNTNSSRTYLQISRLLKAALEIRPLMDTKNRRKSGSIKVFPSLSHPPKLIVKNGCPLPLIKCLSFSSQIENKEKEKIL